MSKTLFMILGCSLIFGRSFLEASQNSQSLPNDQIQTIWTETNTTQAIRENDGKVTVPENIRTYLPSAFFQNINLVEVNILSDAPIDCTFVGCKNLRSVRILDKLKTIGSHAFSHCFNLEKIEIATDLISIQSNAFGNCQSLKSFKIPSSVQKLGSKIFENCKSLTEIKIPKSLISNGWQTFVKDQGLDKGQYNTAGFAHFYFNTWKEKSGEDNYVTLELTERTVESLSFKEVLNRLSARQNDQ